MERCSSDRFIIFVYTYFEVVGKPLSRLARNLSIGTEATCEEVPPIVQLST